MRVHEDVLFDAETTASDTDVSESVDVSHIYGFSVWASWSGTTISGSIKLERSIDGENWEDVGSSEQTISSADTYMWEEVDVFYKYFRVSVTADDANTITTTAKFFGKGS